MEMVISERFHTTPIEVRKQRFSEFCLLMLRLKQYNKKENNNKGTYKKVNGKLRKYVPVTDSQTK